MSVYFHGWWLWLQIGRGPLRVRFGLHLVAHGAGWPLCWLIYWLYLSA